MPEEAVIAIASYLTEGELILTAAEAYAIVAVIETVAAIYTLREQQRRAAQAQRDSYNASLRDRYVMVRGATEPRAMILGRQRVSGPIFFVSSYGTFHEKLVLALALAGHEIDAIEAVYFDNEQLVLDAAVGSTTANVVGLNRREQFGISTSGAAFTLLGPPKSGSVSAIVNYGTTVVTLGVSVAGSVVTVTGATAGQTGTVTISYQPDPSPYAPTILPTRTDNFVLNGSGGGTFTLSAIPNSLVTVATPPTIADGTITDLTAGCTVVGVTLTVTGGTAGAAIQATYTAKDSTFGKARIRGYLGAPGQAADAGLISALPGIWTSAHTASGVPNLVVELDYNLEAFPSGVPNVSALVRGAKCYDPRTGLTAWTENPALLMRYAALSPLSGNLTSGQINDTAIITAANVCDTSATYVVNGQSFTRAFYAAGVVAKSGTRCVDVLNDLAQAMAGKFVFIDGQLRVKAGAYATPLQTLDDTWLHNGQVVQVQPRANRSDIINTVTGKFADQTSDYQIIDYPRVVSSAYIAEDGREMPQDLQFNAITFSGQAQQVAASILRDARQGLRLTVMCNMRAYPVEVFDVLYVTLSRFGWVLKPFEVMDVSWTLDGGIQLTMKETSSTTWALGTTFADVDPAPNTQLPRPFSVANLTGLAVVSGSTTMKRNTDGTVQNRMLVSWTAFTDAGVLSTAGGVEIRYGLATDAEAAWKSVIVGGDQTSAYLDNVHFGDTYIVKARGFNSLAKGAWSGQIKHVVGGVSISIDTPVIVANAATDYGKTAPSPGTRTTSTYSGAATVLWQDDATLTYTNNTGASVEVEVFGSLTWWVTVAGAGYVIGPSFRGTNDVTDISDANAIGITGTSNPTPYSWSRSYTVASTKVLTLKISSGFKTAGSGAAGGVYNWTDMSLKYNAIKR